MKSKNWKLNCLKKVYQFVVLTILFFCFNVKAIGESAVITLEFPAGAENTALGEVGVSYANTIYSVFWNPANVACLYEETYLNLISLKRILIHRNYIRKRHLNTKIKTKIQMIAY